VAHKSALSEVWKRRGIGRVLFFTYSFNFYWFHNFVLPRIKHFSGKDTEVLVIATRDDNPLNSIVGGLGDQFQLKEWSEWGLK